MLVISSFPFYTVLTGSAKPSTEERRTLPMQRHSVSSSRIANIGWENNTMEVQFHNGAVYQYHGVSQSEYQNFLREPSLGSALSRLDKIHPYNPV